MIPARSYFPRRESFAAAWWTRSCRSQAGGAFVSLLRIFCLRIPGRGMCERTFQSFWRRHGDEFEGLWGTDPNSETFDHEGAARHLAALGGRTALLRARTYTPSHDQHDGGAHMKTNNEIVITATAAITRTPDSSARQLQLLIVLQFTNFEPSPKIWANRP